MKKYLCLIFLICGISWQAHADFFGGDDVILGRIFVQTVQELAQLRAILKNGNDTLGLMQQVNDGITKSLNLMQALNPDTDPGIYKDWDKISEALSKVQYIYDQPIQSSDYRVQKNTDESVAEAVTFNNSIYDYANKIDELGERIRTESEAASPGRAAKITAASLGILLELQNQALRTQATGLKLQAEALAIQNRKDKDRTRQMLNMTNELTSALTNQDPQFQLPRFE